MEADEADEPRLREFIDRQLDEGVLWPEPLIQLNPAFEPGESINELVARRELDPECSRIFRLKPRPDSAGDPLRLHRHQADAIRVARTGLPYVLTTGTGSGKSLAYRVPAVRDGRQGCPRPSAAVDRTGRPAAA